MKKALITGITGQDGPYLSRVLLDKGYEVSGIIRDATVSNLANLKFLGVDGRIELIPANLLDLSNVIRLLERIRPDEIYNLAAQSSVAISFEQPIWTLEFNVLSTINFLEAMRILPLEARFYQASSSEMYGRVKTLPVNEETALYPVSPYAISKATDHWLAIHYREAYGLFCSCGILFNHESVLRPRHFVTKKIIATAVRIQRGSRERLRLGNMEIKRDWGYAPEYVKAMWLMLQQERPDDYVIATNEAHSLREFTEHVFTCLGLHWEEHVIIDKDLMRPSDIDIIYGSSEKAEEKLGWEYHISFEELVELLVREELECGAAGGST
jgi:GDPmannose 4,6-dehydratase